MSGSAEPAYRRMIVALGHGGGEPALLRAAADVAKLLGLGLHFVFIEDESLLTMAALPFAREIRLPTHEWLPMQGDRLADELRHAAERARLAVADAVAAFGIANAFQVIRGDPVACLAALSSAADIVVVSSASATGAALGFLRLHEAAHAMPAAVLLLPDNARSRQGPVVAVLRDQRDPALHIAVQAAIAGNSELLLLTNDATATDRAVALGMPREQISGRSLKQDRPAELIAALDGVQERLIVLTRDGAADSAADVARIAATRGVPVLVIEPATGQPDGGTTAR